MTEVLDASSACHVSILLFLNFLLLCPFLKKLNLALAILTSTWFEITIFQAMYEMNFFYMIWIFARMINGAIHLFDNTLRVIFNECFPLIKVSSREPPPPPLICRHWLNTCVPSEIGTLRNADRQAKINELIGNNQVEAVRNGNRKHGTGTKGWWNTVNKIIRSESKALKHQPCYQPWKHKPFLSNEIIQ